jgi:hypothetical protein
MVQSSINKETKEEDEETREGIKNEGKDPKE